jgi:hypothetical protein
MKRAKRTAKRTIVILGLALAGCQGPVTLPVTVTPHVVPVRILATTATYPLLQDLVAGYHISDTVLAVNSTVVNWATIQARLLAELAPDAAGSASGPAWYALTTFLPPDLASEYGWWVAPVGRDAIAIIVHPANPIAALTLRDLRLLMVGEIGNWTAVGGLDMPVVVVSREPGADSYLAFDAHLMRGRLPTGSAQLALSSARMVEIVARTPGAIGYVSLGWLLDQTDQPGVKIISLATDDESSPVLPDPATVNARQYPLLTPVMIVGLAPPAVGSDVYQWFAWMQSDAGQQIVTQHYGSFSPESEE